jgi:processive 1,2-diacylglycerol beta-glucosyltransferase/1,2-diacylglycerol 3-beta-galactosyltransferase
MKQKIALLYLKTGGGHLSGVKALAQVLDEEFSASDEPFILDGFTDDMRFHRFFFEKGYLISSNYLELFWKFFYHVSQWPVMMSLMKPLVSIKLVNHLESSFRKEGITKVVCLHSVLINFAREAIDRIDPAIPLISVVMDPFTAHSTWFYEKNTELVVFSGMMRSTAIKYGMDPARIHEFPFMISRKFDKQYTEAEKRDARRRLGYPESARVILIAGGGEGLRGAERIVTAFIRQKMTETLIVVCGKNRVLQETLTQLVRISKRDNIHIYGFVTCMPDFMNIADCIITKGGPGTVLEALSVKKPVILSTYVPGQEYGNMRFVVDNGLGWFIRNPRKILAQAHTVLYEPDLTDDVSRRIEALRLRSGIRDIGRFIHYFPEKEP